MTITNLLRRPPPAPPARRPLPRTGAVAFARAYGRFARRHPHWAASLFDEHFLLQHASALLHRRIGFGRAVAPAELVAAYLAQLSWAGPLQALSLAGLTEAAADFLRALDDELGPPACPAPAGDVAPPPPADEELGQALAAYAEALREGSNRALDWLWLATKLPHPADRSYCLARALEIDPHSALVHQALAALEREGSRRAPKQP